LNTREIVQVQFKRLKCDDWYFQLDLPAGERVAGNSVRRSAGLS
jgi:hypothetical protein